MSLYKAMPDTKYMLCVYLRTVRLNESKIKSEWRDSQLALRRRNKAYDRLTDFLANARERDQTSPIILSSMAARDARDGDMWEARADASAAAILIFADRAIRRLHEAIGSGAPVKWCAGDEVNGVAVSQAIIAACNAIRHTDEWSAMVLRDGSYNQKDRNFKRAWDSIGPLRALLQEKGRIDEPRSADIIKALSGAPPSADVFFLRIVSIAQSFGFSLAALDDELNAEEAYVNADFDFAR